MNDEPKFLSTGMSMDEALLCGDPSKECLARFAVSSFAQEMSVFINSEIERGTDLPTLMLTMARFQISVHASVSAQTMPRKAIELTARAYQEMVGEFYLEHVNRIQRELAGEPA